MTLALYTASPSRVGYELAQPVKRALKSVQQDLRLLETDPDDVREHRGTPMRSHDGRTDR